MAEGNKVVDREMRSFEATEMARGTGMWS